MKSNVKEALLKVRTNNTSEREFEQILKRVEKSPLGKDAEVWKKHQYDEIKTIHSVIKNGIKELGWTNILGDHGDARNFEGHGGIVLILTLRDPGYNKCFQKKIRQWIKSKYL